MPHLRSTTLDLLRLEVETYLNALEQPRKPVRVYACLQADLPPAADWSNCVLRVTDLNVLAFSDGSDWIRADTGAAI